MSSMFSEDEVDDLLYYARIGDVDEFNALTTELCEREGASMVELLQTARDEASGNGILHMAAANGHNALILQLCQSLSTPSPQNPTMLSILNTQNAAGNTAIHWAALNGHLDAVKVLLEEGSDPTITNQRGHDAVYEAELNDKREVVEWVLKEGGEGLEEGVGGEGEGEAGGDEGEGEDMEGVDVGEGGLAQAVADELKKMDIQEKKKS